MSGIIDKNELVELMTMEPDRSEFYPDSTDKPEWNPITLSLYENKGLCDKFVIPKVATWDWIYNIELVDEKIDEFGQQNKIWEKDRVFVYANSPATVILEFVKWCINNDTQDVYFITPIYDSGEKYFVQKIL